MRPESTGFGAVYFANEVCQGVRAYMYMPGHSFGTF